MIRRWFNRWRRARPTRGDSETLRELEEAHRRMVGLERRLRVATGQGMDGGTDDRHERS